MSDPDRAAHTVRKLCDLGMTGAPYLQSCLTQAPAALLRSSR